MLLERPGRRRVAAPYKLILIDFPGGSVAQGGEGVEGQSLEASRGLER